MRSGSDPPIPGVLEGLVAGLGECTLRDIGMLANPWEIKDVSRYLPLLVIDKAVCSRLGAVGIIRYLDGSSTASIYGFAYEGVPFGETCGF